MSVENNKNFEGLENKKPFSYSESIKREPVLNQNLELEANVQKKLEKWEQKSKEIVAIKTEEKRLEISALKTWELIKEIDEKRNFEAEMTFAQAMIWPTQKYIFEGLKTWELYAV